MYFPNVTPVTSLTSTLGSPQNTPTNQPLEIDSTLANRQRIEFLKLQLVDIHPSSLEELYREVLEVLPDFEEEAIKSLSGLLKQSFHLTNQQLQLAIGLGNLYVKKLAREAFSQASFDRQFIYYKKAMYFYAKAIQIAEHINSPKLKDYHQIASSLFIQLIKDMHGNMEREKSFYKDLDTAKRKNQPDEFEAIYKRIDPYRQFCTCPENYQAIIIHTFYYQVSKVLNLINEETKKKDYNKILDQVRKLIQNPLAEYSITESYITEKYKQSLSHLRRQFECIKETTLNEEVRDFQKTIFTGYQTFFQDLLRDTFNILGPPPMHCNYDFRAMGSLGLEEPCPFSDLEPMILLSDRNPETCSYFKSLFHILNFQMQALGETDFPEYNQIVFSCVHRENPSGFHMDSGPHEDDVLINTPARMAQLQNTSNVDPASADHLVLQSRSLYRNDTDIFTTYQEELNSVLERRLPSQISRRHWRALGFIKTRWEEFQKLEGGGEYENSIVHVKTLYVLQLNYLLGDIAFYLGFEHQNTLDTIETIKQQASPNMFTSESFSLLKNAVGALYKIRCRLHLRYGRQGEQALIPSRSLSLQESAIPSLSITEIFELEKIRFLILRPLYSLLDEVFHGELSIISKDTKKSFEENFKNIDLVKLAFNQIHRHSTTPLQLLATKTFVSYLLSRKTPTEDYFFYYQKLSSHSDIEHLRNHYINTLESYNIQQKAPALEKILKTLYAYPNPSGLRQLELKLRYVFETTMLTTITSEKRVHGENDLFVVIEGPTLGKPCFLKQEIIVTLFDDRGFIRNPHSRFSYSNHFFYFKLQHPNSTWDPGKQQAVGRLLLRIFGREMVTSELMKLTVHSSQNRKPMSYFVQISMTPITSETTLRDLPEKNLGQLDQRQLSELFLSLPLILPGDSWETTYLFSSMDDENEGPSLKIIPTDSSDAWVKPLIPSKDPLKCEVNLYWLLFSKFPEMTLHPETIASFLSLNPTQLLEEWYKDLSIWNSLIRSSFQEEQSSLLCLLNEESGIRLLVQFERLQEFLKQNQDKKIFGADILNTIITMQNDEIVEIGELLSQHFKIQKDNMFRKLDYHRSLSLSSSQSLKFQKISKTTEKKNLYKPAEITKKIEEDHYFNQMISLKQGEKGMRLEKGFELLQRQEKSDLQLQNTALNKLISYTFEELNFSSCTALTNQRLEEFIKRNAQTLTSLDLRNCSEISDPGLQNLDKCLNLEKLYISHCGISDNSLSRIAKCSKLREFSITDCKEIKVFGRSYYITTRPLTFPSLETLEISSCPNLSSITVIAEKLDTIVLSDNPRLCLKTNSFSKNKSPILKTRQIKVEKKHGPIIDEEDSEWFLLEAPISEIKTEKQGAEAKSTVPSSLPKNSINPVEKEHDHTMVVELKPEQDSESEWFLADPFDYKAHLSNRDKRRSVQRLEIPGSLVDKSIETILSNIERAQQTIDQIKDRHVISIIGNTGCGKSTTVNYLMGCEMLELPPDEQNLEPRIETHNPVAKIGHELDSQTEIPEAFLLPSKELVLCDMPGYLETRGQEVAISHAVNIRRIFAQARSNRTFILLDYRSLLVDRADNFSRLKKILKNFFNSFENLNQNNASILIGVTRLPSDQDFDLVRRTIAHLASHGEEGQRWNLTPHLKQIIPINPLDASQREKIIETLIALQASEGAKEFYRTALTAEEILLIENIAKEISKKIEIYWSGEHIENILVEYRKLKSLAFIEHPSIIEVIVALQEKIRNKVEEIILTIQANASIDQPQMRLATIQKMDQLEACCPLDECFDLEKKWVSLQFSKQKEELRTKEHLMQEEINARIQEQLSLLIQQLALALERLVKNPGATTQLYHMSCDTPDLLHTFSQNFPLKEIKNLQNLLQQIDHEMKLRIHKYYSGDLLPLESLKQKKREEAEQLILSAHKQAKIKELEKIFDRTLETLNKKKDVLVKTHHSSLSEHLLKPLDLRLLKKYDSIRPEVEEMIRTFTTLQSLNGSFPCPYQQKIETFLKAIQSEALLCNIHERLERVVHKFNKAELKALNQCYQELSHLNKETFEQACRDARTKLIKQPRKEIHRLLKTIDDHYCSKIQKAITTLEAIKDLPACFSVASEVISILKAVEETIKTQEAKRRQEEIHSLSRQVDQRFEDAKIAIKGHTSLQFTQIAELQLESKNVDLCLIKLQKVLPKLSPFSETWAEIKQARASEDHRYYYKPDHQLTSLEDKLKMELIAFLDFIELYSKVLSLQEQFDLYLDKIKEEARAIIQENPQKLIKYQLTPRGGFSTENITKLKALEQILIRLNHSKNSNEEIHHIILDMQKNYEQVSSHLISEACKKNVEFRVESLKEICATRAFLSNCPEIFTHLKSLKNESPESYQEALKDLVLHINAWINSTEHEKNLNDGHYSDMVRNLVALKNLDHLLKEHQVDIDSSLIEIQFASHLERLFEEALQEIDRDVAEEKFFKVEKIKKFIDVLRISAHLNMNLGYGKKELSLAARSRWQKLLELTKDISTLPRLEQNLRLSQLAKEMIKQYAIATELSLENDFRKFMHKKMFELLSYDHIYKFTEHTKWHKQTYKHEPAASAAVQAIIETFPECERVNIEAYNKKAKGIKFDAALENLICEPSINSDAQDKLTRYYHVYLDLYTTLLGHIIHKKQDFDHKKLKNEIHELSKVLIPYADYLNRKGEQVAQLLAQIFALWTYLNAKNSYSSDKDSYLQPHSTQILTILRALSLDDSNGMQNHLLQVKTGEGKSICLGITAALFALLGYKVNVCCYSSYLSERDYQAFSGLFKELGVGANTQIHYSTICDLAEDLMKDHLPDYRQLVREFLAGKSPSISFNVSQSDKKILLIDEVDVFFGEHFYGQLYKPLISIPAPELIRYVWKKKDILGSLSEEEAVNDVMRSSGIRSVLKDYPNLLQLLRKEIKKMRNTLKWTFPEDKNYDNGILQNDRIGYVDQAGNFGFHFFGYATTFAYLYWQEKGRIQSDRYLIENLCLFITCGSILYSELPNFFKYKIGLTATLEKLSGEENNILENIYKFTKRSFIPSTFHKQSLVEAETLVISGDKEYFEAILQEINETIRKDRACFVILKETKDVNAFKEYLVHLPSDAIASQFTSPEVLTEMIEDQEKAAIISRAPFQYKITLMTRVFGRGIDFVCRDDVLCEKGGVHIILGFYPDTAIEEIQIKGRTCRQDDPGSIRKILFTKDLIEQGLVPSKMKTKEANFDDYEANYSHLNKDQYLALKRESLSHKQFEKRNINLERNRSWHQDSLELVKNIKKGETELVYAFFKKQDD